MEISDDLKTHLDVLKGFSFQKLKRKELGVDYNFSEVATNLEKIYKDLLEIVNNAKLLRVPDEVENNVENIAQTIRNIGEGIVGFIAKDNPNASSEHTSFHQQANTLYQRGLTILGPLIDKIEIAKFKSKEFDGKLGQYLEEIKKAKKLSDDLISNKEKFLNAIAIAKNWIKTKDKALDISVEEKSEYFEDKSREHKGGKIYWWFAGAIVSGAVAISIIIYFIYKVDGDISLGAALLRISAILFPSYFAVFCSQQFLNHKKLYETYKFKNIALKTMKELLKEYTAVPDKQKILSKGIDIIFQEPILKDGSMVQKQIINDLKDILKGKIN